MGSPVYDGEMPRIVPMPVNILTYIHMKEKRYFYIEFLSNFLQAMWAA